ncbi:sigma-54-dependent transcriptional regulator [Ponticoccus alexandrii]|uniref:Response regulator n=1 Tax=Ponticoccus alexandrii TaxID=1943633 RepID=A0ABX7F4Q1_9RHOB|nr:sigma-54 dependent transcriptional regulator [Ponticoccus alexandrii]ETA49674.1 sigma-54 dependent transcriptional regulator [Rhodobacteraceae bacterium PD-2]QRF65511.1 response regulator [Ponticoccus alexandrii]
MSGARLFVVDDDPDHLEGLCDLIGAVGHRTEGFAEARAALEAAVAAPPDLVLTDLRMPGMDGIGLLMALAEAGCDVPVVLLTGHGDVAQAVRAMQQGAEDFLEKPYDAGHLLMVIERALKTGRLKAEVARLQDRLDAQGEFIGESRTMAALRATLSEIAPLDIDVVVTGETGTGKELAARLLHHRGPRPEGPFVVVNCATLPDSGAEAVLFGDARSAPEGADPGLIAAADGGTLFLDQIDALSATLQPKLLRILQTRQAEGDGRALAFRVVASASRPLRDVIGEGSFREDLYYRIAGYEIALPSLRQVPADVPLIFEKFLSAAAARHGRELPAVTFEDRKALQAHHWPGNAHELKIMADRHVLGLKGKDTRRAAGFVAGTGQTLRDLVADFEAQEIARVLDQCNGNTEAAARILGLPRRTLNDKIAKLPLLAGRKR